MSALVNTKGEPIAKVVADPMIEMIERAARDPNVDIDKLERLFQMKERTDKANAEKAYMAAMAEMQPDMPVIEHTKAISYEQKVKDARGNWLKDKNGNIVTETITKSSYTPWEDIDEKVRKKYTDHGFSLRFEVDNAPDKPITVTAIVMHNAGHATRTAIVLPRDDSGSKNAVQSIGSAITYGKRYAACAALNITTRGHDGQTEDDDGEKAHQPMTAHAARKEGLWEKLETEVRETCSTRTEGREWLTRTRQYSDEWRAMPRHWHNYFINEFMTPFMESLPERNDS